uniref:Uncharacterized protein n=1 Tax=Anopheles atroparvus TaxID=41427 RepID=A0AAG5DQ40_ANOAO
MPPCGKRVVRASASTHCSRDRPEGAVKFRLHQRLHRGVGSRFLLYLRSLCIFTWRFLILLRQWFLACLTVERFLPSLPSIFLQGHCNERDEATATNIGKEQE